MLALMPYERSVALPKGIASGILNGGDVGGILDRGGIGGGIMALRGRVSRSNWGRGRDTHGLETGVWRLEMGD